MLRHQPYEKSSEHLPVSKSVSLCGPLYGCRPLYQWALSSLLFLIISTLFIPMLTFQHFHLSTVQVLVPIQPILASFKRPSVDIGTLQSKPDARSDFLSVHFIAFMIPNWPISVLFALSGSLTYRTSFSASLLPFCPHRILINFMSSNFRGYFSAYLEKPISLPAIWTLIWTWNLIIWDNLPFINDLWVTQPLM